MKPMLAANDAISDPKHLPPDLLRHFLHYTRGRQNDELLMTNLDAALRHNHRHIPRNDLIVLTSIFQAEVATLDSRSLSEFPDYLHPHYHMYVDNLGRPVYRQGICNPRERKVKRVAKNAARYVHTECKLKHIAEPHTVRGYRIWLMLYIHEPAIALKQCSH